MVAQTATRNESLSPTQAAYLRAFQRAAAARLVAYRVADGVYSVPSASQPNTEHTVIHTGPAWSCWSCTCEAGRHGRTCLHAATAAYAWKNHTSAVRRQALRAAVRQEVAHDPLAELFA